MGEHRDGCPRHVHRHGVVQVRGHLLVPTVVRRPSFTSIDMGHGASWVIDRRIVNGHYRWSARLHFDGGRRSTRAEDLAAWREARRG